MHNAEGSDNCNVNNVCNIVENTACHGTIENTHNVRVTTDKSNKVSSCKSDIIQDNKRSCNTLA